MRRRALEVCLPIAASIHLSLVFAASRLPLPAAPPVAEPAAPVEIALALGGEESAPVPDAVPTGDAPRLLAVGAAMLAPAPAVAASTPAEAAPVVAAEQGSWFFSAVAAASWDTLRDPIARGISAKHVPLPSNAEGMRFVIEIDARVQWPDGKRPSDVGVKPLASTGQDGRVDHPGLSFQNVPMIGVMREGKVCSVGVAVYPGFAAIGGSCSLENIGQHPARIVHGRIVRESRL